ncbi:MAG: SLBB domain-containing protein [Planctomycetales bacterium]|nr:SLBB domain-containing protein [Planctomycetales bacterium]
MVETNQTTNYRARTWPGAIALAALVALSAGCQTANFRARDLPTTLAAGTVPDLRTVDLGQLGGRSYDTNRIYMGDVLGVQVATGAEKQAPELWQLRVREDGAVDVPLVGPVTVARMNLQEAENAIRTASMQRQVFRHPAVGISITERNVNRITVAGAVNEPKEYEIPATGSTLMTALLAAGGLNEKANRYVEVRQPVGGQIIGGQRNRVAQASFAGPNGMPNSVNAFNASAGAPNEQVVRVDLLSAVTSGTGNIYLNDGAVVTVEEQPPRFVHVIGLVRQQQRVEIPPGENVRLTDAIALAGGTSMSPVIADKVHIVRKRPEQNDTVVIKASIREAKRNSRENIVLAPDDVVAVEETPLTFTLGTLQGLLGIGVNGLNQLR